MKQPPESETEPRFDTGALLRKVRGKMTREAFAELIGVSSSTVVRYEANERAPDADFLLRINVLYGLDPLYVLTGQQSETALLGNEKELIRNYRATDDAGRKVVAAVAAMAAGVRQEQELKK